MNEPERPTQPPESDLTQREQDAILKAAREEVQREAETSEYWRNLLDDDVKTGAVVHLATVVSLVRQGRYGDGQRILEAVMDRDAERRARERMEDRR